MNAIIALLILQTVPMSARPAQTVEAETLDADRLATARQVVETVFPVSQREQMMSAMVGSVTASMKGAIANQPDILRLIEVEPRARAVFDRFVEAQQAKSVTRMQAGLPGMMTAMTRAYARRFTASQLGEMQAFFETPTGRTYVAESATIMSDPDISQWQSRIMSDNIASLGPDVRVLIKELTALAPREKAKR